MRRNFAMAACLAFLSGSLAFGELRPVKVAVEELPKVVLDAAMKAASDADWQLAYRFVENVKGETITWYGVTGRDEQDRLLKLMVRDNGEVIEIKTRIVLDTAPEVVRAALQRKFPTFKPKIVDAVGETTKSTLYYLYRGELDGVECELMAKPDGRWVKKAS